MILQQSGPYHFSVDSSTDIAPFAYGASAFVMHAGVEVARFSPHFDTLTIIAPARLHIEGGSCHIPTSHDLGKWVGTLFLCYIVWRFVKFVLDGVGL